MTPDVSVVIPTHRRLPFLREALGSVLAQTHAALEVVVVVDGDDEETAVEVGRHPDPRVRVLWDGVRRGETGTTVRGLRAATAPYVAVLHDDDRWEPDFVATLLPPLQADPELVVAFGDHAIMRADGTIDADHSDLVTRHHGRDRLAAGRHRPFYREALIAQTLPTVVANLYRRDALDLDDVPELPLLVDVWLNWAAIRGGRPVHFTPRRVSAYRVHDTQATATAVRASRDAGVTLWGGLYDEPELVSIRAELAPRAAHARRKLAISRRAGREGGSMRLAISSLRAQRSLPGFLTVALVLLPSPVARWYDARRVG